MTYTIILITSYIIIIIIISINITVNHDSLHCEAAPIVLNQLARLLLDSLSII